MKLLCLSLFLIPFVPDLALSQCPMESWVQPNAEASDGLGYSVAIRGDIAVAGALFGTGSSFSDAGSAYVLQRSGGTWGLVSEIVATGGSYFFGRAVSLSDTHIVVGSPRDSQPYTEAGSVYIFEESSAGWSQMAKIQASDGSSGQRRFGEDAVIDGNRLLVGATSYNGNVDNAGAAYVFELVGQSWVETAKLFAADGVQGDLFGHSVHLDGDVAFVGAYRHNGQNVDSGAVYVFEKSGSSWVQTQKLLPSDVDGYENFGFALALDGTRALIASVNDDDDGANSGSVYVFESTMNGWVETAKLSPNDGHAHAEFGYSVALDGDQALIGSRLHGSSGTDAGAAYLFEWDGLTWDQVQKFAPEGNGAEFGIAVALDAGTCAIGAWLSDGAAPDSGIVYLGDMSGGGAYVYCVGAPNSAGSGASIGYSGSLSVSANDMTLTTTGGVGGEFGVYCYGPEQDMVPLGDGFLCVSAGSSGLFRLLPPGQCEPDGTFDFAVDFGSPPMNSGSGLVLSGSTWNFQLVYRDFNGVLGSGFNLSDALSVTFCP